MFNKWCFCGIIITVVFVLPVEILAKNFTFSVPKNSLNSDEEFLLVASVSGFSPEETVYVKGAFYLEGSTNYFGFTKKDDIWIKNSTKTVEQKKILIGSWDKTLVVKPDTTDTGFPNSGLYKFKVGYYTVSAEGNISSVHWSDTIVDINLHKSIPTAVPIQTAPFKSPTSSLVPTQAPSIIPTKIIPSPVKVITPPITVLFTDPTRKILGNSTHSALPTLPEGNPKKNVQKKTPFSRHIVLPLLIVSIGTGILSLVTLANAVRKRVNARNGM